MACPDENALVDYAAGALSPMEIERIDEHLDRCSDCREVVAPLLAPTKPRRAPALKPGDRAGRFVIDRALGRGGMAVVYAARDEDLDRQVAIKVLRVRGSGSERATRLLREAQAIARISHPNVVEVYQVGELDSGDLFAAMEHLDGTTLRDWNAEGRDVVAVMLDAAAGLSAAHKAGIIHRDFKPDNVMITSSGQVKVLDFGLAAVEGWPSSVSGSPASGDFDLKLTRTGTVMGTPAYMAPEQHSGTVNERSDQYAFCVALFEVVFGRRPFGGRSMEELVSAKLTGVTIPSGGEVPAHVRSVLARGLQPDPGRRFASMDELRASLQRPRDRRVLVGVALGAALIGTAGAWVALDRPEPVFVRDEAPSEVAAPAGAMVTELENLQSQGRYAEVLQRVDRALASGEVDEVRVAALRLHRGVALRTAGRPLDAYAELEAAFELAREVGADAVGAEAAAELAMLAAFEVSLPAEAPRWFAHAEPLVQRAGAPPRLRLKATLAQAMIALGGGDVAGGRAHAERVQEIAQTVDDAALRAEVASFIGDLLFLEGKLDEAERLHRRQVDRARETFGDSHPTVGGSLLAIAGIQVERGELDAALATTREALKTYESGSEPGHPGAALARMKLGTIADRSGDPAAAREARERALPPLERHLGAAHPWVVSLMHDLAVMHLRQRDFDEAEALLWRAVASVREARGEEAPQLGFLLNRLADAAHYRGDPKRALELRDQAIALLEAQPAVVTRGIPTIKVARARDLIDLGRHEEATKLLATLELSSAPPAERPGALLAQQGRLALHRGDADEGTALLEQAKNQLEQAGIEDLARRREIERYLALAKRQP